jgi:hypothetical protein
MGDKESASISHIFCLSLGYELMSDQELEQKFNSFSTSVTLVVNILKLQDKKLVIVCEQALTSVLGSEESAHLLNAAMFQLAENSLETYYWVCDNFPELQLHIEKKEYVSIYVAQKLTNLGFILGEDFSTNIDGAILVRRDVRVTLMLDCLPSEWKLIKSVVQIL